MQYLAASQKAYKELECVCVSLVPLYNTM
jgi:hypothetical protein